MPLIKRKLRKRRVRRLVKKTKISKIINSEAERLKKKKDVKALEIEVKFKTHYKDKPSKTRYAREIVEYE